MRSSLQLATTDMLADPRPPKQNKIEEVYTLNLSNNGTFLSYDAPSAAAVGEYRRRDHEESKYRGGRRRSQASSTAAT